jgi:hypothetical protein
MNPLNSCRLSLPSSTTWRAIFCQEIARDETEVREVRAQLAALATRSVVIRTPLWYSHQVR